MFKNRLILKNVTIVVAACFAVTIISSCSSSGVVVSADSLRAQKVIEVPNVSQDELYVRANAWCVKHFVSAESVIEYQDKAAGKIIGKYTVDYRVNLDPFRAMQTLIIEAKDERLRITIEDPYEKALSDALIYRNRRAYKKLNTDGKALQYVKNSWDETIAALEKSLFTSVMVDDKW